MSNQIESKSIYSEITMSKENKDNIHELNNKKKASVRLQIYFYIMLLVLFTIYTYLITPLNLALEIVLLTYQLLDNKTDENNIYALSLLKILGWIFLFISPIIPFCLHGLSVIMAQNGFFNFIWTFIVIIIECFLNIPLTFLFKENLFSIYLFQERGFAQSLNSWLVFYPTEFIKSWIEIIRNFIVSIYYIIYASYIYSYNKDNLYLTFIVSSTIAVILLNTLKVIFIIGIIIFKCKTNKFFKDDINIDYEKTN